MQFKSIIRYLAFCCTLILPSLLQAQSGNEVKTDIFISKKGYYDVISHYKFSLGSETKYLSISIPNHHSNSSWGWQLKRTYLSKIKLESKDPIKLNIPFNRWERYNKPMNQMRIYPREYRFFSTKDFYLKPKVYEFTLSYRVHKGITYKESNPNLAEFEYRLMNSGLRGATGLGRLTVNIHFPEGFIQDKSDFSLEFWGAENLESFYSNAFETELNNNVLTVKQKPRTGIGKDMPVFIFNLAGDAQVVPKQFYWFESFRKYGWFQLTVLIVLMFLGYWFRYGWDRKKRIVTSYFPPDGIDPLIASHLIHHDASLTPLIPYWVEKGYLKIEHENEENQVIKIKNLPKEAPVYQRTFFNRIFYKTNKATFPEIYNRLDDSFYTRIKDQTDKSVKEYYTDKSWVMADDVQTMLVLMIPASLGLLTYVLWGIPAAVFLVVVSILLGFANNLILKRNKKGSEVLNELLGFKKFLEMAEVSQINQISEEYPNYFSETISYAMVFGLLGKWRNQFLNLHRSEEEAVDEQFIAINYNREVFFDLENLYENELENWKRLEENQS